MNDIEALKKELTIDKSALDDDCQKLPVQYQEIGDLVLAARRHRDAMKLELEYIHAATKLETRREFAEKAAAEKAAWFTAEQARVDAEQAAIDAEEPDIDSEEVGGPKKKPAKKKAAPKLAAPPVDKPPTEAYIQEATDVKSAVNKAKMKLMEAELALAGCNEVKRSYEMKADQLSNMVQLIKAGYVSYKRMANL